jgi:hypothetical protein
MDTPRETGEILAKNLRPGDVVQGVDQEATITHVNITKTWVVASGTYSDGNMYKTGIGSDQFIRIRVPREPELVLPTPQELIALEEPW